MNTKVPFLWKKLMFSMQQSHIWWHSLGAVDEDGLQELENWFNFWHFHVRQSLEENKESMTPYMINFSIIEDTSD
jgi:hypothetical protein